jgi:hypothetical protein
MAALVFEGEYCLVVADRIDAAIGEQRWHRSHRTGSCRRVT